MGEENFKYRKPKSKNGLYFTLLLILGIFSLIYAIAIIKDTKITENYALWLGIGLIAIAIVILLFMLKKSKRINEVLKNGEIIEGRVTSIEEKKENVYVVNICYTFNNKRMNASGVYKDIDYVPDIKMGNIVRVKVLKSYPVLIECDDFVIYKSGEEGL